LGSAKDTLEQAMLERGLSRFRSVTQLQESLSRT
jgi:hypothetical protein